jgi:hypothetical protein
LVRDEVVGFIRPTCRWYINNPVVEVMATASVRVIIDDFQVDQSNISEDGRVLKSTNTGLGFPLSDMKLKTGSIWSDNIPWSAIRPRVFVDRTPLDVRVSIGSDPSFLAFESDLFQFKINKPTGAEGKTWRELYGVAEITEADVQRAYEDPQDSDHSVGCFYRGFQLTSILGRFFRRSAQKAFTADGAGFTITLRPASMSSCILTGGSQERDKPINHATAELVVNGSLEVVELLLNLREFLRRFVGTPFDPSKRHPGASLPSSADGGAVRSQMSLSNSSDLVHRLQIIDRRLACLLI